MRGFVGPDLVRGMARLAGFSFAEGRCQQLAEELEWLLKEADRIAELGLEAEEGVLIFDPGRHVSRTGEME